MAEVANLINATDLLNNLESSILDKLAPLMTIFKAVGIAILVYVLFLIIRALFKWRTMHKVVKIAKSVEEISQKLDIISAKSSSGTIQIETFVACQD